MSFADALCEELSGLLPKKNCCRRAMAAGMLVSAKTEGSRTVTLQCRRSGSADAVTELLQKVYGTVPERIFTGAHGHKNCQLTLSSAGAVRTVRQLQEATEGNPPEKELFCCENCTSAFLRGMFLLYGTVNDPHRSSHLEFSFPGEPAAKLPEQVLTMCGYPPRRTVRKNRLGLYFKDSTVIGDLVGYMGSRHLMYEFYNSRIERDIRNNENRATNCVAKNIQKSISAASKQLDAINLLIETGRLDALPEPLRRTAMLRYRNPDVSLEELRNLHEPPISKSGLNHRLQKLLEEAEEQEKSQTKAETAENK